MNVQGRSSAEEAAAARAISCQIGDGIWSKADGSLKENTEEEEKLHPSACLSKRSSGSTASLEIKNYDEDDGILDDDEEEVGLHRASDRESYSSTASNYSFSAAVAPKANESITDKLPEQSEHRYK